MRLMAVLMLLLPLAGCYPACHDIGPAPPMTPPMIDASGAAIIEEPEPPVVAMQAGPRHAECIGAELVGPDAIPTNNIDAYWRLAETWIRDPQAAAAAGARQRARALAELDYGVICDAYERIAVDLCRRRVWAASAAELATADT
jgi:hypothetical protein